MEDRSKWIREHVEAALENGEFEAWYQPIVRSVTGAISDFEALARWKSPEKGMISPGEFIPILEELGLSALLDETMLRNVLTDIQWKIQAGVEVQPVSVNLSQTDFADDTLVGRLTALVDEAKVSHDDIVFEITESASVEAPEVLTRVIAEFHANGFKVWMDDFGSGYSSLNVLAQYDFDLIKLDMKFLQSFSMDGKGATVLRHILAMAQELKMLTLVEGVETLEQFMFLKSYACDRMQGFFFQRPQPLSYYKEHDFRIGDTPSFGGEHRATGDYYDRIKFDQVGDDDLPPVLASFLKEAPQAMLELRDNYLTFLHSNMEYMTFLVRHGIVTPNPEDVRVRGEWKLEIQPYLKAYVMESKEKDAWIPFTDQMPDGEIHGWMRVVAQDPVRNALCFRMIMMER